MNVNGDARGLTLSEMPLMIPAAGLASGIALCGGVFAADWWMAVVLAVAVVVAVWRGCPRIAFALAAGLLGMAVWMVHAPAVVETGKEAVFKGELADVYDYGSSQKVVVDAGNGARIGMTVYDYPHLLERGDSVEVRGILLPPVLQTTVPDEADGAMFARTHPLSAVCMVGDDGFRVISVASGVRGWLNSLRRSLLNAIRHSGLSQPAGEFLGAVLLGDRGIEPDVRENFARAGLSHMLALSGTHVSTVALLLAMLLLPVEMAGGRRWRLMVTMVALWGYAVLTGMSPSVVRAVVMASFVVVGRLSGRYPSQMNSLFGAAIAILIFQPSALFMPGFQLSFVAVAGILMIVPPVLAWARGYRWGKQRVVYGLVNAVLLPVAAVVATAPLSSWLFHYFPVWFLVANLPVALLLPLFLGGGIAVTVASFAGVSAGWLVDALDWLYGMVERLAAIVAALPGNMEGKTIYFGWWILYPLYLGMFMVWRGWTAGRKVFVINGLALLVVSVALVSVASPVYPETEWYVWRHNRGVAVVCRDGEDVWLLTDAAQKYHQEIGEQAAVRLTDFLGKRGARLCGVCGERFDSDQVKATPGVWMLGDCRVVFVNGKTDVIETASEYEDAGYVVVSAGFKGDVMEVSRSFPGAVTVLSPSLPPLRRRRYVRELSAQGEDYLLNIPPEVSRYNPSTK